MSELLNCPFCGREPRPPAYWQGGNQWSVKCHWDCPSNTVSDGPGPVIEAWNTRAIPELPLVAPDNLVEGEWYVVRFHGDEFVGKYETSNSWPRFRSASFVAEVRQVDSIYGPLRFKIGGTE